MVAADEGIPSEGDGNSTTLLPDLIINDLSWSPANPETGEQVTITATVKKPGRCSFRINKYSFFTVTETI
ncbi:hypothetical protein [Methanosarcina horonobensis]|uniref:hypothetical protein n=1 Tax=Methanosarcina horonobensis TaxID=418008 RepID=UPI0022B90676|nr:hypothetical protein [Methanosarcina horonobensis]